MPPAIELLTYPDLRWARRDIKSTNLLAQVMAKQAANQSGAYEALMVDANGWLPRLDHPVFSLSRIMRFMSACQPRNSAWDNPPDNASRRERSRYFVN
jgi:hypothetical protein